MNRRRDFPPVPVYQAAIYHGAEKRSNQGGEDVRCRIFIKRGAHSKTVGMGIVRSFAPKVECLTAGDLHQLLLAQLCEFFVHSFDFHFEGVQFFLCFHGNISFKFQFYGMRRLSIHCTQCTSFARQGNTLSLNMSRRSAESTLSFVITHFLSLAHGTVWIVAEE